MSEKLDYIVKPRDIDTTQKFMAKHESIWNDDFVGGTAFVAIIGLIMVIFGGPSGLLILCIVIILIYYAIAQRMNETEDRRHTERIIAEQKARTQKEAEFYSQKFNDIISKSEEIVNEILPYFESSAMLCINKAKIEFSENVYSPFWSEIEEASKFLACFKDALDQLCMNSEVYTYTLKNLDHTFPIPFPYGTKISISQRVIDEYKTTIRKAQTNPTFSIIWEQRRNSEILVGGFGTLENAINNMSNVLYSAIYDLKSSIISELQEMKYVQKEQLQNFETSQVYLQDILNSMDNKLYYIQWKEKPLGRFHHR